MEENETEIVIDESGDKEDKVGFFSRIKSGLSKTRSKLSDGVGRVFLGEKIIDDDLFEEIETILLSSDVGVAATTQIMDGLAKKVARKELANAESLYAHLKEQLSDAYLKLSELYENKGDKINAYKYYKNQFLGYQIYFF